MVAGQPALRSVDRECLARRLSPERVDRRGSPWRVAVRGPCRCTVWPGAAVPPGPENRASAHQGWPGTWEVRPLPNRHGGRGAASPESSRPSAGVGPHGANTGARVGPRRAKDNEVRRAGRSEVGGPRSSVDTGELAPPEPGRAKGALGQGTAGGKHDGRTEARTHVNGMSADRGTGAASAADELHLAGAPPGFTAAVGDRPTKGPDKHARLTLNYRATSRLYFCAFLPLTVPHILTVPRSGQFFDVSSLRVGPVAGCQVPAGLLAKLRGHCLTHHWPR